MNLSDWFGLLSSAFLIGCLCGLLFKTRFSRWTAALIGTLIALIPAPIEPRCSIAMYLFGLIDNVSVPLLAGACIKVNLSEKPSHKITACAGLVIFGLVLFIGALGFLPFDFYRYGYYPVFAAVTAIGAICLTDNTGAIILTVGFLLYSIGIYENYFESVVDPLLWMAAVIYLSTRFFKTPCPAQTIVSDNT